MWSALFPLGVASFAGAIVIHFVYPEISRWVGAFTGLFLGLVWCMWQGSRFERWIKHPLPDGLQLLRGPWRELGERTYRQLRIRDQHSQTQEKRLHDFLSAIQASPNGVVLLDDEGKIEWMNQTACEHLGLQTPRDLQQHIVHLLRAPAFTKFYAQSDHDKEIQVDAPGAAWGKSRNLSIHLHHYGQGKELMLTRDVTALVLADAMRRDFVANVSHEIRTPLTVLAGFVETLQSLPLDAQETARYLELMSVQASRMQTLVADLLTLSQLEGSPAPGAQDLVEIPSLLKQIESDAQSLSAVQSHSEMAVHRLVFDAPEVSQVLGSRHELFSAFSNLVSNAVRYTPAGGAVHVSVRRTPEGGMTFSVQDTGPGIAPEHLPRLSERFYRVDRSRSRETGGTGLGLAITKHVIQRHGGSLSIESQLGKGSTFSLHLPAARVR